MTLQKKSYTKPKLTVHGDVEVLTQGNKTGTKTDNMFLSGTPTNNLTFSD